MAAERDESVTIDPSRLGPASAGSSSTGTGRSPSSTARLVLGEFGDEDVFDRAAAERRARRDRDLHEVMRAASSRRSQAPLARGRHAGSSRTCVVRPGFAELVAGYDPLVLSSGFHELIEPMLAREGVEVELLANRLDPRPDGWRVLWRDERPCDIVRRAVQARRAPGSGRSSTSATATPTAAPRSPPNGSSRATGSPSTSRPRVSPFEPVRRPPRRPSRRLAELTACRSLLIPEPYDFALSTERFRAFGPDLANLWHEGGLHRVVGGREVRIEAAPGGVDVEPLDAEIAPVVASCSASASTWTPSTAFAARPTRCSRDRRALARLPAAARAGSVRDARHLDHGAAGLALLGVRDPQPDDRALRRAGRRAYAFPTRERLARRGPRRSSSRSASRAARRST